jgi:hypothetical protein
MHVLSTACPWRCIPKNLPPRNALHDYIDWLPVFEGGQICVYAASILCFLPAIGSGPVF